MADVRVSARIPKEMEQELGEFMREEHLNRSAALRRLLRLGLARHRQERALRLLSQGRGSVGRAAEIARMNLWEFADLLRARRIRWVSDDLGDELKASWKR